MKTRQGVHRIQNLRRPRELSMEADVQLYIPVLLRGELW
jgi:hypothetical protein